MGQTMRGGLIFKVEPSPRQVVVGGYGVRLTMYADDGSGMVYDFSPGTATALADALAAVAERVVAS
jgi:hypothetical protein